MKVDEGSACLNITGEGVSIGEKARGSQGLSLSSRALIKRSINASFFISPITSRKIVLTRGNGSTSV